MNLQTVIFIGRSGAGKGMQSGMLQKYMGEHSPDVPVLYIETGDHFRRHIKDSAYTWDLAREVNEVGGRQPDFLAVWIWSHIFIEKIRGGEHIIFDGTPRSLGEAKMLNTALPFYKRENPAVIFLNVSEEWAEARLRGRGRADDLNPEVVAKRLAFFNKDVAPAVEYYREAPEYRFFEINGEQTPDEVFNDVKRELGI
ncbi:MAG: nucleoside monophosphate kinase [Candidatus Yonathbacteria bacterium]|nr:nucleoside monophosphate kinase [Candidatus Yonathbacteria bacterium]